MLSIHTRKYVVFLGTALIATVTGLLFAQEAAIAPLEIATPTPAPTNTAKPAIRGMARLQELEKKAEERDMMAERAANLEEELLSLQQQLGVGDTTRPRTGRGRLDSLERKAAQFEQVVLINQAKTEQIRLLTEENDELRLAMSETEAEYVKLQDRYQAMVNSNKLLNAIIESLQQTIDQLLLGNFEYYEVSEEGETLSSIAGLPMVYGDTNKASLLISPNENRVQDLEELQVGDVLVIPRFPASGKYLW
jgi:hypothetical protein